MTQNQTHQLKKKSKKTKFALSQIESSFEEMYDDIQTAKYLVNENRIGSDNANLIASKLEFNCEKITKIIKGEFEYG